jgi:phenylalanine-4-hydroxylase
MFDAIRKLSILKESKDIKASRILEAEQEIITLQNQTDHLSEMDCLRNMHWWSVEYGIIGTPKEFKLYGAGLLSSIGESKWCLSEEVKKHPFSLDVIHQKFDITQPQPQLFATPDFAHLSKVLEELANTMALRKGGKEGVEKLILSDEVGTIELSTGLQISGKFTTLIPNPKNTTQAAYIQTVGPSALAYRNQEIVGHGSLYHASGFGSPIGKLKGSNLAIEDMTPSDLEAFGIVEGNTVMLTFESGVVVEGKIVTGVRNLFGKIMLISFVDCIVRFQEQVLFQPQWGQFDMAIGKSIKSAYAGPADAQHFPFERHLLSPTPTHPAADQRDKLYQSIQDIMEDNHDFQTKIEAFGPILETVDSKDWLLALDFHTLCVAKDNTVWKEKALKSLVKIKTNNPSLGHLIEDGLQLYSN